MHNPLDLLIAQLNALLLEENLEAALSLMKSWLDPLTMDFRLHGKVFASAELDQICLQIGKCALGRSAVEKSALPNKDTTHTSKCSSVFVTSELHLTGGHTKLLEDYIRGLGQFDIKILVTDPGNNVDRIKISEYFADLPIELRFSPKFSSLLTKLNWLIDNLGLLSPEKCYLLNYANDPIAVAAMQPSLVSKPIFVHHCDHTLTLGMHIPQSQHLDFRLQGFSNCRNNLNISNNVLYPLVCQDLGCPPASGRFFTHGALHTGTSGSYKFEIPYAFDFMSELPKWLQLTGGMHTHFGELSAAAISSIRKELDTLKIAQNKFQIVPFVKSLWQSLIDHKIDLYIDSFPIGGARSLVEAMGAGIPTAIHYSYATPLWSNIDFAYPKAKILETSEDLRNWLTSLNVETLETHSQLARHYYLEHHHPDLLKNVLDIALYKSTEESNTEIAHAYKTNALRAFMDQFVPISFHPPLQKQLLSYLIAFLRMTAINEVDAHIYLKEQLSPADYNLFVELTAEINNKSQAVEIINKIRPILTDRQRIDSEKLTELLYQITTTNNFQKEPKQKTISPKIKAKLLWYRLMSKYIHFVRPHL